MMLTKCYCVVYHVADFSADNEFICHQDAYRDHNNALLVAKDLAKCLDVVDDVYVIDGLTGEVLNTILKDAPQEDKTEEDDTPADNTEKNNAPTPMSETKKPKLPAFEDSLDDGTGGVWRLTDADEWDYDCTGLMCSDCAYHDDEQLCLVHNPLTKEERDIQIESAKARMKK